MRKRNLIDLPQATMDLFARCVMALKPPPELTLSQWADEYRMLSAESSAEPGRWHTDKAPYHADILMAANPEQIGTFIFEAGVELSTPNYVEQRDGLLPPWKFEASYE